MEGTRDPKFTGSDLNKTAFGTGLLDGAYWWDAERVKMWMFGHTYWNCGFVREGIRVVTREQPMGVQWGCAGIHGEPR